ncbi:7TM diverse intracellular signaling domain-containing protein [Algoriphagus ratkowskyi]|uniref:7TM diverse intracellular signaling domain-containing protein n=1 Tax=Algoriphagus ratkowskyi TaxID=57028 RepID=UPI001CB8B570|nr:7TM diverse intracellular signaling domain-containing protein [Algoriphagus ratkowskyi]
MIFPLSRYLGIFGGEDREGVTNYYICTESSWETNNWKEGLFVNPFDLKGGQIDLGFQEDTVIIGLDISPYLKLNGDPKFLEIINPSFRSVEIFRVNAKGEVVFLGKDGIQYMLSNKYGNPNPTFKLTDSKDWLPYVILKISSFEPVRFNAVISSEASYYSNFNKRTIFINIYVGIMLALFFYNLFLYFSGLDVLYLSYSMYVLFIALAQLSISGHSYYYFLYQNPKLFELSIIGFTSLAGLLGLYFVKVFLHTKERLPLVNKLLGLLMMSYLVTFILRLFGAVSLSYMLTDINGLLVVILVFYTAIVLARRGIRSAYFFLGAWTFFLIGILVYIMQTQGLLDLGFYPNLAMLVGTAFEALLLSFALADKINLLKKEKEKEQAERLIALAKNEHLVREQNVMLEDKVKIRTDELEQAIRNLQNTQSQLVNQEKMASLGQLTAGIAHEINNPINFVSSNIMPLKRDIKDIMEVIEFYRSRGAMEFTPDSQKEAKQLEEDLELDYVLDEVEHLLKGMDDGARRTVEIVKGLRLFSRVDEQDMKSVDLHDGINSTLILLNSTMPTKIRVNLDYDELPLVECLAGKINQVFMNIINNAIHALADHINTIVDPHILIRTKSLVDAVTIEIIDNGPGMPECVKQRIFEPFFTTKAVGKGTGLGLSIVYSIIENHKGKLEVNSEESQGTTFKITLPIYQSTERYE